MSLRRGIGVGLLVAGLQALVLVPIALTRFVDGDEGAYAYAGRLAVHGRIPYRDFFYEQAPLLPYVYGVWTAVAGESWYAVRFLSAAIAVAVGVLLYTTVRRSGRAALLVAIVAYAGSGLVFGYFTIVKTFALSSLLLFGAYALVSGQAVRGRNWLVAGALLGLALDTRLLLAAALPAFAVVAFRAGRLRALAAGFGAALVPGLVFFALDPYGFYFDNVRYHSLKTPHGLVGNFHEKAQTAATLLGLEPTDRWLGIQLALLLAAGVAVVLWRKRVSLALALAVSLGLASFLPTPTYAQYFSVTVPFLAVLAGELASGLRLRRSTLAFGAACLAVYLGAAVAAGRAFEANDPLLRPSIDSVRKVSSRIERETSPGERVLSGWPGYLFGTHAQALPGYTNQFAPVAARKISRARARELHVTSERQLERLIRSRKVRLVVARNWVTTPPFAHWDAALAAGRYRLVATVQTAQIYRR